jgi:hypothetical protein
MGIDLDCGKNSFGCSYSSWNELRSIVIEATLKYLKRIVNKEYSENDIDYRYHDTIRNLLNEIKNQNKTLYTTTTSNQEQEQEKEQEYSFFSEKKLQTFISIVGSEMSYIDALISFDVGGLFTFCYKSDCEGFYSSGNSMDICRLFNTIELFVKELDAETHSAIYNKQNGTFSDGYEGLYKVFENSWKNDLIVTIS